MLRFLPLVLLTISTLGPVQAQQTGPTPSLAELLRQLPATADATNPLTGVPMTNALCKASLTELKANLPTLVDLTESPAAAVRSFAIVSFICIAPGDPAVPSVDQHTPWAAEQLLVPFIARLTRCLTDPVRSVRNACFLLLGNLVEFIRPTPPSLLDVLYKALEDSDSTRPLLFSTEQSERWPGPGLIMGPAIVYALIPANVTVQVDPITQKRAAKADPDVQAAILRFLHRPDQTSQSLSETINNIVIAGLTDRDFNAQLLSFLDHPDDTVRYTLISELDRLTFPASSVPTVQARLTQLASDPTASSQLRAVAARMLPCWGKDRTCVLLDPVQAAPR